MIKIVDTLISVLYIKKVRCSFKSYQEMLGDGKMIIKHGDVIMRHSLLLSQPINAPEVISFALPVGNS